MLSWICGRVKTVELGLLDVEDLESGAIFKCKPSAEQTFDLKEGDEGFFLGDYTPGKDSIFIIKRVDARRMLKPLIEKDLYEAASVFTLIPLIDDPFLEAYKKMKDVEVIVETTVEDKTLTT